MNKDLKECIDFLEKLIAFKSVKAEPVDGGPFGEENKKVLIYSLEMLEKIGARCKNLDGYIGVADFFANNSKEQAFASNGHVSESQKSIENCDVGKDMFCILIHLDVVPTDDNWHSDPFVLTKKDGKLFGRGTIDDKGPFAAIYIAFKKLLEEGFSLKRNVRFLLGCDEESGWDCMKHYAKTESFPSIGIAPDASFPVINYEKGILRFLLGIPKPSEINYIEGGDRSNIVAPWARVSTTKPVKNEAKKLLVSNSSLEKGNNIYTFKGKAAHASTPLLGVNAVEKMLDFLSDDFADLKDILDLVKENGFKSVTNKEYELSKHYNVKLTNNIGKISCDEDLIYFTIDIRYPKEITPEELLSLAKKKGEVFQDSVLVKNPLFVDENNELVKKLVSAYRQVTKDNTKPLITGGGTYARALPLAVSFGPVFPGEEELAHMANEYISIEGLDKCIKIYYIALKELLFN